MEKEIVAFLKNFDGNCDFQTYLELYKRLEEAGEKGCYFTGNDFHYADHLFHWGFVKRLDTPIRKNGVYRGNEITFYSL